MAKKDLNDSQWVDQRMGALHPGDWQPDSLRGMARFRQRQRAARRHLVEWLAASFAGVAACIALAIFLSPGACAKSMTCADGRPHSSAPPLIEQPAPAPVRPVDPPAPKVAPLVAQAARPKAPTPPKAAPAPVPANFKEVGLPGAAIAVEIYSDYQCPVCAIVFRDTVPALLDQYVRTGKIRLLHRDFPLAQHQYSRLATRYANASGVAGMYDTVVNQIFRTQATWERDGNIDAQVMQVLPPGTLQKVRDLVNSDPHLDDTVNADLAMVNVDHIDHTPTFVIVSGGKRQVLPGVPQLSMLKAYLDQLLGGH